MDEDPLWRKSSKDMSENSYQKEYEIV